jgi:hypothetical protein
VLIISSSSPSFAVPSNEEAIPAACNTLRIAYWNSPLSHGAVKEGEEDEIISTT